MGFDFAHGAGNLKLELHRHGPDFAVWCNYKYLNAGPGAVGGAFIHERHFDADLPRLAGWWGHDKATRFQMPRDFAPIRSAEAWQLSNPPIVSLAALRASLDIFNEAGMDRIRLKSLALTGYLEQALLDAAVPGLEIATPGDPAGRGAQLSLRVKGAGPDVHDRLIAAGAVADWREPDIIRVAPAPLYNRFAEMDDFAGMLKQAVG